MEVAAAPEGRRNRAGVGAERELELLFDRHAEYVRRYALRLLRNRDDAEDVVQLTFLKALRALRSGVRPERPRRWLAAIAHNECRMHFRTASRRPAEVALDVALDHAAAPDGSASAGEIGEAFGQLAPNQRAALVLRELEGRSYADIAVALDLTESAVETLLFRARRALREQFEEEGDCADAERLLAAGSLDDESRRRLRAHTRACRACATLERRRRGRLAAAGRKLGAIWPLPSWSPSFFGGGAAKVAVAVVAATVGAGGAVEVAKTDAAKPTPKPAPVAQHRQQTAPPVARAVPKQAAPAAAPHLHAKSRPAAARPPVPAPVPIPLPLPVEAKHETAASGPAPAPIPESPQPADAPVAAPVPEPSAAPKSTAAPQPTTLPQPAALPQQLPSLPPVLEQEPPSLPPVLEQEPPPLPTAPPELVTAPPLPPVPSVPSPDLAALTR
jgi:RNA polymerase sigma factor (sigma-70 family)